MLIDRTDVAYRIVHHLTQLDLTPCRDDYDNHIVLTVGIGDRTVTLTDVDDTPWATTTGPNYAKADRFDGEVTEDDICILALWLASDILPAAAIAHDALSAVARDEDSVTQISARADYSGIIVSLMAGSVDVTAEIGEDGGACIDASWDYRTSPRIPDMYGAEMLADTLSILAEHDDPAAAVTALAEMHEIDGYVDVIYHFAPGMDTELGQFGDTAVVTSGVHAVATIAGEGPYTLVTIDDVETTHWTSSTEMGAYIATL